MRTFKSWLSAFRLRTLPLSISGIVIGSCLAAFNGYFSLTIFILAMLVTLALQILSNLANDYGDGVKGTDNENRVGPMRALQSGQISPSQMVKGLKINVLIIVILTTALIFIAFGHLYLIYSFIFLVLGGVSVYAAMKYTMGESAYGYRGLGDVYVFVFFGLLSVIGSYFLYSKQFDFITVLPAAVIGLLSVGVLNLNNMRDIDSDRLSNKMTLAVKMGKQTAKNYHLSLVIAAMILGIIFSLIYHSSSWNYLFLLAYIPLSIHVFKIVKAQKSSDYDGQLKILALSTFFLSLLMGIGFLI